MGRPDNGSAARWQIVKYGSICWEGKMAGEEAIQVRAGCSGDVRTGSRRCFLGGWGLVHIQDCAEGRKLLSMEEVVDLIGVTSWVVLTD